ncbi:MAG: Synerg-CTERM sorting domain-containing protein, partial [Cloacibacillus sp.]
VRDVTVTNTTFAGNWVLQKGANWACGGAVYFENSANSRGTKKIESCTIVGNTAIYDGYHVMAAAIGGGLYAEAGKNQALELRNSILVGNSTSVTDTAERGEGNVAFHAEHDGKHADIYGNASLMGYNLAAVVSENATKTTSDTVNSDFSDSTKGSYFVKWLANGSFVPDGWTPKGASFDLSEEKTGPMAGAYEMRDTVTVATIPLKDDGTKDSLNNNPAFDKIPKSAITVSCDALAVIRPQSSNGDIGAREVFFNSSNLPSSPEFTNPTPLTSGGQKPVNIYQYVPTNITKIHIDRDGGFFKSIEMLNCGMDYAIWVPGYWGLPKVLDMRVTSFGVMVGYLKSGMYSLDAVPAYLRDGKYTNKSYISDMPGLKSSLAPEQGTLSFPKNEITVREGEALPVQLLIASADVTDPRMIWSVSSADNILRATAADADDPEYSGWAWVKGLHKGSATLKATSIRSMEDNKDDPEFWATATCKINVAYPASAVYIKSISLESSAAELYLDSSAKGTMRVVFDKSNPDQAVNVPYSVEWSVSDETIAAVKQRASNPVWATLTPLKAGSVVVTAKVTQGGELQEKDIYTANYTVVIKATGGGGIVDETPDGVSVSPVKPAISVPGIVTSAPQFAADVDLVATLIGANSANITADSKGNLTLKNSLVSRSAEQAVAAAIKDGKLEAGTKIEGMHTLPIFTATGNELREILATGFAVSGDVLGVGRPQELHLFKVFPDDREGRLFDFAATSGDYKDKTFTVLDGSNNVPEKIIASESYTLVVFVQDCGEFDLDKTENGAVTDPVAILNTKAASAAPDAPSSSGSGSGGCNAGYGLLACLALLPALALKKHKK